MTRRALVIRPCGWAYIYDRALVTALFELAPERYAERVGGYTRIVRTLRRRGRAVPLFSILCIFSLFSLTLLTLLSLLALLALLVLLVLSPLSPLLSLSPLSSLSSPLLSIKPFVRETT